MGVLRWKDLPIIFGYVLLPTFLLFFNHTNLVKGKVIYDIVYVVTAILVAPLAVLHARVWHRFELKIALIILVGIAFLVVKYFVIFQTHELRPIFQPFAFFMEMKPLFYLAWTLIWVKAFGLPSFTCIEKSAVYFSLLILIDFIVKVAFEGFPVRPEVADEANYDNLLVLIGLLSYLNLRGRLKLELPLLIFVLATLVAQSKTGIVCFIIISMIYSIGRESLYKLFFLGLFSVFGVAIILTRLDHSGVSSFEDIDRVKMFLSFINVFTALRTEEILFGVFPGIPLGFEDDYIGWFITHQTEGTWGGVGLHPFNYHGMWYRLVLSWGVIPILATLFIVALRFKYQRANISIFILIVLQGVTMGVFYLSTVAPMFLLFLCTFFLNVDKRAGGSNCEFALGRERSHFY